MKNPAGKERRFWTGARVALACAAFGGVALVASNCKSNDTANLSQQQQPKVTITTKQGGQPAQPQQRPQLDTVPAAAWDTEIQSVDGAKFRLSDYKDKVVVIDL